MAGPGSEGAESVASLADAIHFLLKIHTWPIADGKFALTPEARPRHDPVEERLYCEAWAVLASAAATAYCAPTETIDLHWIERAHQQALGSTEVKLDTPTFLNLLIIARNGLRPHALGQ